MTRSTQMIGDVHPALNPDAQAITVLTGTPTISGWISIDDHTLTLTTDTAVAPIRYTLSAYTLSTLRAELPIGLGAILATNDWAAVGAVALVPVELGIVAGQAYTLSAYTSALWRVMRPLADGIDTLATTVQTLVAQTDIRQASGPWLDVWGLVWAIPRLAAETDDAYRRRIIYTLTLPRVSNQAIEALIQQALGRSARVDDGGQGGVFTLNSHASTWWPGGAGAWGPQQYGQFTVTITDDTDADITTLIALIQQYKAAGTTFVVTTSYAPIGRMTFAQMRATYEE